MKNNTHQGWAMGPNPIIDGELTRPNPILTFSPVWIFDRKYQPHFGDRHALILLKRRTHKQVSFTRAYSGWRHSGARELEELGEGRAFLRWLQRHDLSIDWHEADFLPHPYFLAPSAPNHAPGDEYAQQHSFAIRPVQVAGRKIKLYVKDQDILSLLNLPYGKEEDFLELVMSYITQRFQWEKWHAPAPTFLDWVISHGLRPIFAPRQLGFSPLKLVGGSLAA
jgi:hypothetical protein